MGWTKFIVILRQGRIFLNFKEIVWKMRDGMFRSIKENFRLREIKKPSKVFFGVVHFCDRGAGVIEMF